MPRHGVCCAPVIVCVHRRLARTVAKPASSSGLVSGAGRLNTAGTGRLGLVRREGRAFSGLLRRPRQPCVCLAVVAACCSSHNNRASDSCSHTLPCRLSISLRGPSSCPDAIAGVDEECCWVSPPPSQDTCAASPAAGGGDVRSLGKREPAWLGQVSPLVHAVALVGRWWVNTLLFLALCLLACLAALREGLSLVTERLQRQLLMLRSSSMVTLP